MYSDDRLIQLYFNRQKGGLNKAFCGHRSSSVFLTNILEYRLDLKLSQPRLHLNGNFRDFDRRIFLTISFCLRSLQ